MLKEVLPLVHQYKVAYEKAVKEGKFAKAKDYQESFIDAFKNLIYGMKKERLLPEEFEPSMRVNLENSFNLLREFNDAYIDQLMLSVKQKMSELPADSQFFLKLLEIDKERSDSVPGVTSQAE